MIRSVSVSGAPCFSEEGAILDDLGRVNFIFGTNGAGKTTISRALADPSIFPDSTILQEGPHDEYTLKVYNCDYVKSIFGTAADLRGVFLLGAENKQARQEIETLTSPVGQLTKNQVKYRTKLRLIEETKEELAAACAVLADELWKKRSQVTELIQPMFEGYNGSKAKLAAEVAKIDAASRADPGAAETIDVEELTTKARSLFVADITKEEKFALLQTDATINSPHYPLLGKCLSGNKDSQLSALIEEFNSSDWVADGRKYLTSSKGICPFCQQIVAEDLLEQLSRYFDSQFNNDIRCLRDLDHNYQSFVEQVDRLLEEARARDTQFLAKDKFEVAAKELERGLQVNSSSIKDKLRAPSEVVSLLDLNANISIVNGVLKEANDAIRASNELLESRITARIKLVHECWVYFVRNVVAAELQIHENRLVQINKRMESLKKARDAANDRVLAATERVKMLEEEIVSSKGTITAINALLESVGFTNFRLEGSETLTDGYTIVRSDGTLVEDTLSEGERTFISFLYYYHQISSQPAGDSEPADVVAVIDDPISSLDSDILFVVSSLIRSIIQLARG